MITRVLLSAAALAAAPGWVKAQDERARLLSYYPCAGALSLPALEYLNDWTNATKNDPCELAPEDFASLFGIPMTDPAPPSAAASPSDYLTQALGFVESYFAAQSPARLFLYQTLILGEGSADGRWGPNTAAAFAGSLETYTAIGGSDEHWGILGEHRVPRLLRWIEEAHFASATGGEFPD